MSKVTVKSKTKLVATPAEFDVYKTRWGYVAYSYEDYKKLKRINMIYHKALKQAGKWKRWIRKAPHNRVIRKWTRNDQGWKVGSSIVGPEPQPSVCDWFSKKLVKLNREPVGRWFDGHTYIKTDNEAAVEYQKSRKPRFKAEDVEEPTWDTKQIDSLLRLAEGWHASL